MEHFDWLKGFVLPYVNFAIFLILAIYFFRTPLGRMAKSRREQFDIAKREATRLKDEAEKKVGDLETRLAGLDAEISRLKSDLKTQAEREAGEILRNAEILASHLRDEAKRIADAEIEKTRHALRGEIIGSVMAEVRRRVETDVDEGKHQLLIRNRITNLTEVKP